MTVELTSTKAYHKLPCAHMQWFDTDVTNEPMTGPCSKWHGYDRSIIFTFKGVPDQHGWIVGFGDLKPLKQFLEYYFDHTALAPADDPRLKEIHAANDAGLVELRILPYGVSMEMSALFVWEQVNPWIVDITDGRAYVASVECREHDGNSAIVSANGESARMQAHKFFVDENDPLYCYDDWDWESPADAMSRLNFNR